MVTFWAQSMIEYGGASGGGILDRIIGAVSSAWYWIEASLTSNRPAWIAGGVCLLVLLWFFRKR